MTTVYRVETAVDKYQFVRADDSHAITKYRFDGNELRTEWQAPPVHRGNPQKREPDVWCWMPFDSFFAVSAKVAHDLCTFIDESCELLPIQLDGLSLLVCNVTCVVSALDENKSRHKPEMPDWIDEYVFHPDRFEYSLFKIPQTSIKEVLCVEWLGDPRDNFKGAVESLGLKGLQFRKLWSDE